MLLRLPATAALVALALLGGTATARAQGQVGGRPERPYRGLFASGTSGSEQSLSANGSLGAGWDDNILFDLPGGRDPRTAVKGWLGTFGGGLSYSLDRTRFGLGASVNSNERYFPSQERLVSGHSASLGMRAGLSPRTSLTASQSVSYMPFTFTSVFPAAVEAELGQADGPPLDLVTNDREYLILSNDVHLTHELAQRVTADLGYGYGRRNTSLHGGRMTVQHADAGLRFELNRDFGLNLGYRRRYGHYDAEDRTIQQENIDAGLDFQKALSFSRRTTVSFASGSSIVRTSSRTRYRVSGAANINHEVGRTWIAAAAYNRNVSIVETLAEPVMSDAITGSFGGLVSRRVQFTSNVRAAVGRIGLEEGDTGHDTYLAGAALTYAVSRFVNVGANYTYYRYKFGTAVLLPPGIPREIERQSVRAQVSLWAPLMNRARRP